MQEFLRGSGILLAYFAVAVVILFSIRWLTKVPDELFRKLLHFVLQASYILFAYAYETWWKSALFGFLIVAVAYPIFSLLGHTKSFSSFVNERKAGEFKSSLIQPLISGLARQTEEKI